jgi:hypothetical protein
VTTNARGAAAEAFRRGAPALGLPEVQAGLVPAPTTCSSGREALAELLRKQPGASTRCSAVPTCWPWAC